ncbi:MAG: DUF4922 domain-containing protein [Ignavibacteriae bacterium HGW-Ignavibacteriae-2]|nr:MAG: DUF4922 domain-containing protein [Ignavibacteriae bacterium HGW-Ignavibacteriae-2]
MLMLNKVFVDEKSIDKYSDSKTLADRTRALLKYQIETWELARQGYNLLDSVEVKIFEFDDFEIKVQFNPGRIVSSSAKVDKDSISARPCFLCYKNLPEEQKAIPYFRDYLILANPYPIFPEHFTIPKIDHVKQQIEGNIEGMLNLSYDIGKYYTVFYNGPQCGASAPDHMHFQAGLKNFMPIDTEYKKLISDNSDILQETDEVRIWGVKNNLRRFFIIESSNKKKLIKGFRKIYDVLHSLNAHSETEPMMNILSYYDDKKWKLIIFPRTKHRPDHFFREGDKNILLSPAAVDFGGVCITPREQDFNKLTKDILIEIFRQVSIPEEIYEYYNKTLMREISSSQS